MEVSIGVGSKEHSVSRLDRAGIQDSIDDSADVGHRVDLSDRVLSMQ